MLAGRYRVVDKGYVELTWAVSSDTMFQKIERGLIEMGDGSKKEVQSEDRQEALVLRLEDALSADALGLLSSAEARYAAAVNATTAPVAVATTTST
jgi:hypothetical protein